MMPEVYSIVYKPKSQKRSRANAYLRVPLSEAKVTVEYGIEGDMKGENPKRQLNIMCYETLESLRAEGFNTAPGQMGEQLILRGIDLVDHAPGTVVRIGSSVLVEVLELRSGCDRFEKYQGKSPRLAARRLGVMARVMQGGQIRVGDAVEVVAGS